MVVTPTLYLALQNFILSLFPEHYLAAPESYNYSFEKFWGNML